LKTQNYLKPLTLNSLVLRENSADRNGPLTQFLVGG
jgi:hypothetical protein